MIIAGGFYERNNNYLYNCNYNFTDLLYLDSKILGQKFFQKRCHSKIESSEKYFCNGSGDFE